MVRLIASGRVETAAEAQRGPDGAKEVHQTPFIRTGFVKDTRYFQFIWSQEGGIRRLFYDFLARF